MHPTHASTRLVAAAAAVVLALAPGAATAANDSAAGDSASPAIVLAGTERAEQKFIPGVTDSGTGVLRERERRLGIQTPTLVASDSRFDLVGDDGALALGGALAAAAVAASLALGAGARRRRILT
jgi:hypothetical protein